MSRDTGSRCGKGVFVVIRLRSNLPKLVGRVSLVGKRNITDVASSVGDARVSDVLGGQSISCVLQAGNDVMALRWVGNIATWIPPGVDLGGVCRPIRCRVNYIGSS